MNLDIDFLALYVTNPGKVSLKSVTYWEEFVLLPGKLAGSTLYLLRTIFSFSVISDPGTEVSAADFKGRVVNLEELISLSLPEELGVITLSLRGKIIT